MTRAATLPILCVGLVLLVLLGPVLDAKAILPESIEIHTAQVMKERAQAKRRQERWHLIQRYREWREWRRDDVRRRVHSWAVHELKLGVYEYGYNIVPRYDAYGIPWCAKFVTYCVLKGEPGHPLPSNPASSSSWAQAVKCHRAHLRPVCLRVNVKPGDVVVFHGHVGIFHQWVGGHRLWFSCIEGNCSDAVRMRRHHVSVVVVFGRVLPWRIPERFKSIVK